MITCIFTLIPDPAEVDLREEAHSHMERVFHGMVVYAAVLPVVPRAKEVVQFHNLNGEFPAIINQYIVQHVTYMVEEASRPKKEITVDADSFEAPECDMRATIYVEPLKPTTK